MEKNFSQEDTDDSRLESEFSLFGTSTADSCMRSRISASKTYEEEPKKKKKIKVPFLTTSKRFEIPTLQEVIGPGSYEVCEIAAEERFQRKIVPFNSTSPKDTLLNYQMHVPGPGSYQQQQIEKYVNPLFFVHRKQYEVYEVPEEPDQPGPGQYEISNSLLSGPTYKRVFKGPPRLPQPRKPASLNVNYLSPYSYPEPEKKNVQEKQKKSRFELRHMVEQFLKDESQRCFSSQLANINHEMVFHKNTNSFISKTPNPYTHYIPMKEGPAPNQYEISVKSNRRPMAIFKSKIQRKVF